MRIVYRRARCAPLRGTQRAERAERFVDDERLARDSCRLPAQDAAT